MDITTVLIIAGLFLFYSLCSKYLSKTIITAPMIFTTVGLLVSIFWQDFFEARDSGKETVHLLAEITLVFVLFTDAARINFKILSKDHVLPQRMLLIGLPLTIIFGALVAYFFFGKFIFWEAAVLAAILAPTDAALGQAVVSSKDVPLRIRQTLGVESGLNDGISLPAVLMFASLASVAAAEQTGFYWVKFALLQVGLGPLVGITVGFIGAKLVSRFVDKDWMSRTFEGIAALSIALIAYNTSELVQGNGFIAAFVGGLTFGRFLSHRCTFLYEFAESEGQVFTLTTFLVFGTIALPLIGENFHWTYVVYGLVSLTIIRMLPVAISLIGTGVDKHTNLFLGWFGPRGLASILFGLLVLDDANIKHSDQLMSIVIITILLSIFLHGMTAYPASHKFGKFEEEKSE